MRQIALYISLALLLLGCGGEHDMPESKLCSIASLWRYVSGGSISIPDDIFVEGYVVANDRYGEYNSAIVIADESGGISVEIDLDDIEAILPLYSRVRVTCSGLTIASVGAKLLLGAEPTGEYVVDRIDGSMVLNYIDILPTDSTTPAIRHRKISQLKATDVLSMVVIDNLAPIEKEQWMLWTDKDVDSGRTITTVRHFTDGVDTLSVVTDAKCHYATEPLLSYPVRLSGILDWYRGGIAFRVINHGVDMYQ